MVNNQKAQAAMEFLMTYGWAILVVLLAIGSLAYFGVLNPTNLLPDKCMLPVGLYCQEYRIYSSETSSDTISLRIQNGMGEGIVIKTITIEGTALTNCFLPANEIDGPYNDEYNGLNGWHLENGETKTVVITCDSIAASRNKVRGKILMDYCEDTATDDDDCTDFSHTLDGELMARVETG